MSNNHKAMNNINDQVESAANKLRIASIPIAVIAVVSGWAAGPLLRFAPPLLIWALGTFIALSLALFCIFIMFRDGDDDGDQLRVALFFLCASVVAGVILLVVGGIAAANSARLDRQCGLLEIDAMSLKPQRKDSLDLFEKFGCRPQGVGTLEFQDKLPVNARLIT